MAVKSSFLAIEAYDNNHISAKERTEDVLVYTAYYIVQVQSLEWYSWTENMRLLNEGIGMAIKDLFERINHKPHKYFRVSIRSPYYPCAITGDTDGQTDIQFFHDIAEEIEVCAGIREFIDVPLKVEVSIKLQ